MPFSKVQSEKLSQSVVRQIERLILQGVLRPGERLPSERELSERMGVSRPSLREAVAELQAAGLLETRAGSGIYVSGDIESQFSPALTRLFATHDEAVNDYIDFRRDMEGLAIERACLYGSDTDLKVVATLFERMEAAHKKRDPSEEAQLDAEFHMAIVEASHNIVLLHVMRSLFGLLQEGVFFNRQVMFRQRMTRDMILEQHRAIFEALMARDGAAGRAAIDAHLDFVVEALEGQRQADRNEEVAKIRFEHAQAR